MGNYYNLKLPFEIGNFLLHDSGKIDSTHQCKDYVGYTLISIDEYDWGYALGVAKGKSVTRDIDYFAFTPETQDTWSKWE